MKRRIIIMGIITAVVLIGGSIWLWQKKTRQSTVPLPPDKQVQSSAEPQNFLSWKDDLGFSFSYPDDVAVNKHDEDQDNYAHVELTHKDHQGRLVVWVKDPPPLSKTGKLVATTEEWIGTQNELKDALAVDTSWGGQKAKKIKVTNPKPKLYVVAYYDELIYYVEVDLADSDYWSAVADKAISTFSFSPKKETSDEGDSSGGDSGSVDEEEVVE